MIFKTLKDRCYYFRDLPDNRLVPNQWYLIMLDGHSFSKKVKKRFKRPFDDSFVSAMNETALHLCNKLQSVKFAFVQSDEITLFCKDSSESEMEFSGRYCKLQSLCASMATAKFNHIMWKNDVDDEFEFDCKVWNVPDEDEAFAWYRFRRTDCERNSINQYAESFMSHKQRNGVTRTDLVEKLKADGHDWNSLPNEWKYGRAIEKEPCISHGVERDKFFVKPANTATFWKY